MWDHNTEVLGLKTSQRALEQTVKRNTGLEGVPVHRRHRSGNQQTKVANVFFLKKNALTGIIQPIIKNGKVWSMTPRRKKDKK